MTRPVRVSLLLAFLTSIFWPPAGQAQAPVPQAEAKESEKAMRLRQKIDQMKQDLTVLEEQLAAEQEKSRQKQIADESRREQLEAQREERTHTENQAKQPDSGSGLQTNTSRRSLERGFALNILADQRALWTSPARIRLQDLQWLVPLGTLPGGLIASDTSIEKALPTRPSLINRSRQMSKYGLASLLGATGGFYFWGRLTQNDHARETGVLGGEAVANAFLDTSILKIETGRQRPLEGNGKGEFWHGGGSFPSDHAAGAWSLASVIAREYPGPMAQLLAYGAASAISASRVLGREHFASDTFVGSALGWYLGRQVYRAHHHPESDAARWGTFIRNSEGTKPEDMGSPYVPLDSWIYPVFERLAALGYVQSGFAGMRPWTRMECARLVQEAGGLIQEADVAAGEAVLLYRALADEFSPEISLLDGGRNVGARVESVYTRVTGIAGAPLTDGFHFGQTIINDYGRPYQNGFNNVSGVSARATAGPLVFYLRGEYQHASAGPALSDSARQHISQIDGLSLPPDSPIAARNHLEFVEAYAGINLKDYQITVGRQSLWWGPGRGGPMMFSNNAEPIAMLRANRVTPFKLPSILGWLGPMRTEFFIGQLAGSDFVFTPLGLVGHWGRALDPQPFIHGQRFSFKPTPNVEFGLSRTTIYGGPGYPLTWHRFISSLFTTGNENPGGASKPGDRRSAVDFTYRIPKLRNSLTFYGDGFTDDQFSPIAYADRSAWHAGLYSSHLPLVTKLDLRIEGVYTDVPPGGGPISPGAFYFNATWRSGYTNNGNLIGSWIGRGSQGAQAWSTYWLSPRKSIQFNYRHQKVSKDFTPNGGTLSDFGAGTDLWLRPALSISAHIQYEQWSFPVLAHGAQSNVTSAMQLTFWPSHWKVESRR